MRENITSLHRSKQSWKAASSMFAKDMDCASSSKVCLRRLYVTLVYPQAPVAPAYPQAPQYAAPTPPPPAPAPAPAPMPPVAPMNAQGETPDEDLPF